MPGMEVLPGFLTLSQTHGQHTSTSFFKTKFDLHECRSAYNGGTYFTIIVSR